MRRADRLFQIVQLLSCDRVTTARQIAEQLEVSERTIYRDIQDLSLSGMPIESETGVGYRLMKGFHLPPLMFDEEELAALLLGVRIVQSRTDSHLSRAAKQAIAKIEKVLPAHLKSGFRRQEIMVPDYSGLYPEVPYLSELRQAVKQQHKITFDCTREDGQHSSRTVHPLGIFFWNHVWTMLAWCELRESFRHFRLDRIQQLSRCDECFRSTEGQTLEDYLATMEECDGGC